MLLAGSLLGAASRGAAQPAGSLEGYVFDGQTQQRLGNAILSLVGGHAQTHTSDSGFFRLSSLPIGNVNVRIEHRGYASAVEAVEVVSAAQADFTLFPSATVLEAIRVRSRSRAASAPPSKDGAKTVALRPDGQPTSSATPNDLIARVPGALVVSGGQLGSGSSIRLRGLKSLIGASNPLIYLDGVRVSGGEPRLGGGVGAASGTVFRKFNEPTVLDQLDPATIERIEVLPGAAAATLYGTGGANGVILIYTRR